MCTVSDDSGVQIQKVQMSVSQQVRPGDLLAYVDGQLVPLPAPTISEMIHNLTRGYILLRERSESHVPAS